MEGKSLTVSSDDEQMRKMISQLYERLDRLEAQKQALIKEEEVMDKEVEVKQDPKIVRMLHVIKIRIKDLDSAIVDLVEVINRIVAIISPKNLTKEILES
ncbi:MAG: hypothetical protein HQM12_22525 [SAR324 cluster bacterium]|nr:hypothetical protein [SAR324 cluster bacterium]